MKTNKQKIVIIGGGYGGLKTALDLAAAGEFNITIISEVADFRYYSSLYRTATGGSRDLSSVMLDEVIGDKHIKLIHAKATALDRAQKHIKTDDGQEVPYDYLVLSLGVVTNYFHIEGLPEFAFGIKTLEDAEELKIHLHQKIIDGGKPDLNYVVVGGGPTGIELAGALGDYVRYICDKHDLPRRTIHVDLVEAAPRLVPRMPAPLARRIARQLRSKGVKLYFKAAVQGQTADELLVNGKPIRSHTVIWTAGMSNNPFFSENGFQLTRNGKVRVDQYLQAEPSIFVIGDNADTPYSGMAQTAIYDGVYMARSLEAIITQQSNPKPYVAKQPIYVMPAGPNWAAVQWGSVRLYGRIGWIMRRAADFVGYRDYEPFFKATKHWFAEFDRQDLCAHCQPDDSLSAKNVAF
ncbi:MAG: NAD(P)/FAD-dependent oxidoreductase [Candidatus Saccharimonadales bacterium]